ncbi:MFS transporter [Allopusillimonas soli]|uniref:MFS transporter n=1 Tax=Allopusillimonas soli TaxID=659016 RepID=A0A853FCG4_9BURK|nr:MFS transporter [Allopusillimonas soli]NYT37627.1 MFS transporter [Allopusillimonas soli]TEA74410.1 MFS transporter [Allopusillimonas soli]
MNASPAAIADRDARNAAVALGLALPVDVLLYLLLPMYHDLFGVTLAQAGILLAANRLVRIMGYGWVARRYARYGDRPACLWAVGSAAVCGVGFATLSGFWLLLPLRLLWGLAFAALNLSTQALGTILPEGASRRYGRSRAYIALGPVVALPLGAVMTQLWGPRAIFFLAAGAALLGLLAARILPATPHEQPAARRGLRLPNSLDIWSFLEGLTLDGLFIVGLSYLGKDALPGGAVVVAGSLLAVRYLGEIVLSPVGGRMADRAGPERVLVALSLLTALALTGFGLGWLWTCSAIIVVLRALQLPLVAPIVARRTPGPGRVQALAARAIWRDIGAGFGPMMAGLLLPLVSAPWLYGVPAVLLGWAAIACARAR